MPYSLSERVLFGLLVVTGDDLAKLLGLMDRIEADPIGASVGAALDAEGHAVYVAQVGSYRLYYLIGPTGAISFTELLSD